MEKVSSLAERINARVEQHKHDLADKQQILDSRMMQLLEHRKQLSVMTAGRFETAIIPRLEELIRHFDNGTVEVVHADADCSCVCSFSHTIRFPATVRLTIALSPGEKESLTARYALSILPALMEYNQNAEKTFSIEDEEALVSWVDARILEFVDSYLRIETHPLYQKDNTVVDIVCGMRIPIIAATSSVELRGRTFHFCSEHCKEVFIKDNA